MDYMIGCNYWDSENGTDMWAHFSAETIDADFRELYRYGVRYLRVFPNWRDFQPVRTLRAWRGQFGEYVIGENEEEYDTNPDCIDPQQIKNFLTLCDLAKKHGIKLMVSVVTGWMSGRLFVPPALEGLNHITDAESLMFQTKFIHGFVNAVKHHESIVMWDIGNECNCLGQASTRAQAYHWTSTVVNAIRSADPTREITSGMHALDAEEDSGIWIIRDQGELCDYLTPHPYPSPTIGGDVEPYTSFRTTILPSAQLEFYRGISGKPTMIQEQGTFSNSIGNRAMAAQFLRINLLSGLANDSRGYFWWCAQEHTHLSKAPYGWSMMERELGLVFRDRSPKPVALEMKKIQELFAALPALPEKKIDAVCVLSYGQNRWQVGASTYILAKEAGLNIRMRNTDTAIPDAPIYMLPCITGWKVIQKKTYDAILEKVAAGATLYISFNTGHLSDFETVTGLSSDGFRNYTQSKTARFAFGDITYRGTKEILINALDAEVLASNNEDRPVLTVHSYGKGKIYYLSFPLEQIVWDEIDGFDPEKTQAYHKIYREIFKNTDLGHTVTTDCPYLGITEHSLSDTHRIVTVLNYTNRPMTPALSIAEGWKVTTLYGSSEVIDGCDGLILNLEQ